MIHDIYNTQYTEDKGYTERIHDLQRIQIYIEYRTYQCTGCI